MAKEAENKLPLPHAFLIYHVTPLAVHVNNVISSAAISWNSIVSLVVKIFKFSVIHAPDIRGRAAASRGNTKTMYTRETVIYYAQYVRKIFNNAINRLCACDFEWREDHTADRKRTRFNRTAGNHFSCEPNENHCSCHLSWNEISGLVLMCVARGKKFLSENQLNRQKYLALALRLTRSKK